MHTFRMGLGIGQGQGRAPGAAEQHPLVDAEVLANALKVGNQIPGGVVVQAGVGRRAPATTLIEGDDAVQVRVEEAPTQGITTRPRTAMDKHHRQTIRITAFVDIQHVRFRHG